MNDITNFRLSKAANDVADKLVATGKFDHGTSAAKFVCCKEFLRKIRPLHIRCLRQQWQQL